MKVAVVGTRGFPNVQGGVEAHCENLYPLLVESGCEVFVFTRTPYVGKNIKEYKGVKLIPVSCPKRKILEPAWHTFKAIFQARKLNPDILHFHAIGPSFFVPLAKLLGFKVVMTNHGPDYLRKKWGSIVRILIKLGEYLGSKFSDEVICVSENIGRSVENKYQRRTKVIPNGVAISKICKTEEILKKFALVKGRYVLAVGRFVPEKGFLDLMKAFQEAAIPDWRLVIVGRADHQDKYSDAIETKARENPGVVLTGFLSGQSLADIYSHAGLFVLPSYHEGLAIVLLEALSYGLSCLVSDVPANREIGLEDNRYFEPGAIKELSEKIREYVVRPLTPEQKDQQIDLICKKYSWAAIADKTLAVYRQVLNR